MYDENKDLINLLHRSVIETINPIVREKFETIILEKCAKLVPSSNFEEVVLHFLNIDIIDLVGNLEYLRSYSEAQYKAMQYKKSYWLRSVKKSTKDATNSTVKAACMTLVDEVERWSKDSSSFLCEFPGFEKITPKRMWLAYTNDLNWAILQVVKAKNKKATGVAPIVENVVKQDKLPMVESTDMTNVSTRSLMLYDMPVGSEKASKLEIKSIEESSGIDMSDMESYDATSYSDYNYSKDRKIRTLIRNLDLYSDLPEEQKNQLILKEFKSFDDTDLEILSYIYEKISVVEYIQQGYLQLKLSIPDILKAVGFNSDSSNNYRQIRARLAKISSYRFYDIARINGKDEVVKIFSTFDLSYEEVESNVPGEKKYDLNAPIVSLSQEFLRSYVKSKTIAVSKEQRNQLQLSLSRLLFYPLHQSRLDLFIANANQGLISNQLVFNTSYAYFASKVQLKAKSVSGKMKSVAAALDELIKNDMLIESYEILPRHKMKIVFKPLDSMELQTICKELNMIVNV